MTSDGLHKAVARTTDARGTIIRAAAAWQPAGTDTPVLTEPLCEMQEALAQPVALAASTTGPAALLADPAELSGKPCPEV